MDFHKQQISTIIISFTSSLVDTIPRIVDQRLHSVWELPAQAVNIIIVIAVLCDAPGPTRAELRPSSYMLAVYIVN